MAGGRPSVITEETLAKLEFAFANSFTDEEASLYANIHISTLYRYCEDNLEFRDRKEALKKQPNIKAKLNWIKKMEEGEYQASKEWLERKSRDEFSLKTEVDTKLKGELKVNSVKQMSDDELLGVIQQNGTK